MLPETPTSIPDLRLDRLPINIDAPRGELNTDGRLRLEIELVASESGENWIGLSEEIILWNRALIHGSYKGRRDEYSSIMRSLGTYDFPTPESPISTT